MFIEFKLSKDFQRRGMDVLPKAPNRRTITKKFDETNVNICFTGQDTLVCNVANGTCIGRLMRAVDKHAQSWYNDYITSEKGDD